MEEADVEGGPLRVGRNSIRMKAYKIGMGTEFRDEVVITGHILCADTDTISSSKQFGLWTLEKPS